jgi:hypothetical protein
MFTEVSSHADVVNVVLTVGTGPLGNHHLEIVAVKWKVLKGFASIIK